MRPAWKSIADRNGRVLRNRTSSCGFGIHLATMARTLWRFVRGSNSSHSLDRGAATPVASRSKRALPARVERKASAWEAARPIRVQEQGGDARVMLPSETDSQSAGFYLLPRVTVSVAGIEPATPSFQARMSTNDLHADGQSGWNRTSMDLLPKKVDDHCPTL
jgi:hypothetical protein